MTVGFVRLFSLWIYLLFFFLIPLENIRSASYYVATDGSDSNPGTLQLPWKNLNYAITQAGAGDSIIMRGGVYVTNEVWIRGDHGHGGSGGQYLTIKNYPGETPSIGGQRRVIVDSVAYLRVEGLTFRSPYRISGGGIGFQVVNNKFIGPQPSYGAIEFSADSGLIEGNIIEVTGGGNTRDHGIYLHAGHNNVIRNNTITGISGYGIHVYDAVASGGSHARIGYENILIENNFISNSRQRAGIIIAHDDNLEAKNIRIQKNIIVKNALNGIRLRSFSIDISIYNNTIYNNGSASSHPDGLSAVSISESAVRDVVIKNNILEMSDPSGYHVQNRENSPGIIVERNLYWGTGSPMLLNVSDLNALYGDPLFVDPANNDFHLQENSPAINTGINVGLPYIGSAPDLGACEFGMQNLLIEPSSLNFGEVRIGTVMADSVKLSNLGTANLEVFSVFLTGSNPGEFSVENIFPFTLSPGFAGNIVLSFLPESEGQKSAVLVLQTDNPLNNPVNINLAGTGLPVLTPNITVSDTFYNFGNVNLDSSATHSFELTNTGNAVLDVFATTLTGSNPQYFSVFSGAAPFTLDPGSGHDLVLDFTPTTLGVKNAILQIESNDTSHDLLEIALQGTGTILTDSGTPGDQSPDHFEFYPNYPNPFNPSTHIVFAIPFESQVSITVYDLMGRKIKALFNKVVTPGVYTQEWNGHDAAGKNAATGLYICKIQASAVQLDKSFGKSIKILLLR